MLLHNLLFDVVSVARSVQYSRFRAVLLWRSFGLLPRSRALITKTLYKTDCNLAHSGHLAVLRVMARGPFSWFAL